MKQSYIINRERALTTEELYRAIPSAFSRTPYSNVSERYRHIPTHEVIESLGSVGYLPFSARQGGTRKPNKEFHTRHLITFKKEFIGTLSPTLYVMNSSDRSSSYHMGIGLFRAECLNLFMLTLASNFVTYKFAHIQRTYTATIISESLKLAESFPLLIHTVERFKRTELSENHRKQFAESVLAMRYNRGDSAPYGAERLLTIRRRADIGTDLFSTMNVIQENITQTNHGQHRGEKTSRKVGITRDLELNQGIWQLAESFAIN